jgi:hypothetical protein
MPVLKKNLTALKPGGQITKHAGKGSLAEQLAPGQKSTITAGAPIDRTMNNYAKATPMANPAPGNPSGVDMGPTDFGT